ncbi:hypothetical protein TSUD_399430 [Trifolium subterraneum]|uniref:Elongation factor Ts, mitochondrial n=1 Tax=Trifolium subterraneum TaxID=3900 RepID=A0A2Z6P6U0_TRISU|nr:hypothetical protein TSUD_399430 [Trifolium subterraneum]
MGENVRLRRGYVMPAPSHGLVSTYLHTTPQPGLGHIAGILSLEVDGGKTQADALLRIESELAMHVVAAKPLFLTKKLVSLDALENEREILKSQAEASGKSQMAIDKMVEGRLHKYFEDVVLMDQKYYEKMLVLLLRSGFARHPASQLDFNGLIKSRWKCSVYLSLMAHVLDQM